MEPTPEEIEEYENNLLREVKAEVAECDPHREEKNKFKSLLAIAGEKTNKKTKELYREHIPASVFGVSSDEVADSMSISENELMAQLTNGLTMKSESVSKITSTFRTKKSKEIEGFDFDLIAPFTLRITRVRALGLMTYGD